jgi:hypothetical protein
MNFIFGKNTMKYLKGLQKKDIQYVKDNVFSVIKSQNEGIEILEQDEPTDLSYLMPIQGGLKYEIWLSLQGYELHLSINKNLWCEWYSWDHQDIRESYINAVTGFIKGEYRVIEHYRGNKCVKAALEKPNKDKWEPLASWSVITLPFPWRKTFKIIQNV